MASSSAPVFLVWMLGGVVVLAVVTLGFAGLNLLRRRRELDHIERMKAIECGYVLPKDLPPDQSGETVTSIAVGVPAVAGTMAFIGSIFGAGAYAWPAAAVTSVAALASATYLYTRRDDRRSEAGRPSALAKPPAYDPEAFEVAHRD